MTFLPGRDSIIDDLLVVCAIAQSAFVSPENFSALPYLQYLIQGRSRETLIEHLLAMSIKTRFLEERTGLLTQKDRRQALIGKYAEAGVKKSDAICIRLALDKLIHHNRIEIRATDWRSIVLERENELPSAMKLIPAGVHEGKRVIVSIEGTTRKGDPWQFDIDLYKLVDEVLRVLE